MTAVRVAQYGTKHAHAAGKLRAIIDNPDVELAGVLEPDEERRRAMARRRRPLPKRQLVRQRERNAGRRQHRRGRLRRPHPPRPRSDGTLRAGRQACLVRQTGRRQLAPVAAHHRLWPKQQRADRSDGLYVSLSRRLPADRRVGEVRFLGRYFRPAHAYRHGDGRTGASPRSAAISAASSTSSAATCSIRLSGCLAGRAR